MTEAFAHDRDEWPSATMQEDGEDAAQTEAVWAAGMDVSAFSSVRAYLSAIGKQPLLNAAEEVEIGKRIEAGLYAARILLLRNSSEGINVQPADKVILQYESQESRPADDELEWLKHDGEQARRRMLASNLRLVVSVAKRYSGRTMPLLDRVQEGNLGLMRAVEKFDFGMGVKFSTYATWWISQSISKAIHKKGSLISRPAEMDVQVGRAWKAKRELYQELGRVPTAEEVAAKAFNGALTAEKVSELLALGLDPVSLDVEVGEFGDASFGDLVIDDELFDLSDLMAERGKAEVVERALETLDIRSRAVLMLRFGLGAAHGLELSREEIGRRLGISRETVRKIERSALNYLRRPEQLRLLEGYGELSPDVVTEPVRKRPASRRRG